GANRIAPIGLADAAVEVGRGVLLAQQAADRADARVPAQVVHGDGDPVGLEDAVAVDELDELDEGPAGEQVLEAGGAAARGGERTFGERDDSRAEGAGQDGAAVGGAGV